MPSASARSSRPSPALRWGGWAAGAAALALVFLLYAEPDFVVMMADQVWSCF